MSYETFITCDGENCNARVEVRQAGDMPLGWVAIQYFQSSGVVLNGQKPVQNQQIFKLLCSWRCANKITQSFIREKIND